MNREARAAKAAVERMGAVAVGAVADSVLGAAECLRAQRPDATDVWSVRVGYAALYSFGGSSVRRAR